MSVSTVAIEETASITARRPIVAFVNDDVSASALRTGLEGTEHEFETKRGDIRNLIRLMQSETEFHSVIADISGVPDPLDALEDLRRVCPPDVMVARWPARRCHLPSSSRSWNATRRSDGYALTAGGARSPDGWS